MTRNIHEDLGRKHTARGPSDRSFGLTAVVFFVLVGIAPLRRHEPLRIWALAVSAPLLLIALARPGLLSMFNKAWMGLGALLGRVMTPVITALLFFLIFTPIGILRRLMGKDALQLAFDKNAATYWIERCPPGPAPDEMSNQF